MTPPPHIGKKFPKMSFFCPVPLFSFLFGMEVKSFQHTHLIIFYNSSRCQNQNFSSSFALPSPPLYNLWDKVHTWLAEIISFKLFVFFFRRTSSSRGSPASTNVTPAAAAASFQELGLEFFFAFSAALKLSSVLFASDSFPFCPPSKNCLLHSLDDEQ